MDLKFTPAPEKLTEEVILKKYHDFNSISYDLDTIDLDFIQEDNELYFYKEGNSDHSNDNWIFAIKAPFMYEQSNIDNKSYELTYVVEKKTVGYKLVKQLTEEGKRWLSDPNRSFPIVIDPTAVNSVIQAGIESSEVDYLKNKRNIQFFPNATGGAAWYAVYQTANAGTIAVEKCPQSLACDATPDWSVVTSDLDTADADTDNFNPSTWKEGDTLYTAWFDNSRDAYQFNTVNTTTDGLGTTCNGADGGTVGVAYVSIAVANDGDVYIAVIAVPTTGTYEKVSKVTSGGCTETNLTSINSTTPGIDQGDFPEMLTIGNDALLIFAADNGLRASGYDDTNAVWDADTNDIDINGATANNTTIDMSAVTDGTDVWVIQRNGTTGDSETFKCSACSVTAANTWTALDEPWGSGLTATSYVGLSYISGTNVLAAVILDDGFNSAACTTSGTSDCYLSKSTDADTISWGSQFAFAGGGATEINNSGMTANVASEDQVAVAYFDVTNNEFEFATVPENILLLLLLVPFFRKLFFGKVKRLRKPTLFQ